MDITELIHIPENTDFYEIYNDYVTYYNEAGENEFEHISTLSKLFVIKTNIQKRLHSTEKGLKGWLFYEKSHWDRITDLYKKNNGKDLEEILESKNKIESKIEFLIKNPTFYVNDVQLVHNEGEDEPLEFEDKLIRVATDLYNFLKKIAPEDPDRRSPYFIISNLLELFCTHFINANHNTALRLIIDEISNKYYPYKLKYYFQLTSSEKQQINLKAEKGVGAPMREDVPQEEIESVVSKILADAKNGQTVKATFQGETRSFLIVHQGGSRDGKANINQIFKYFEAAHPELINLSSRQFKERIKLAVPDKMK